MINTTLPIETPEGISFSYDLASVTDRGWAYLLDFLIRVLLVLLIGAVVTLLFGTRPTVGVGLWLVIAFFMEWGYFVLFDVIWQGQSPGKRTFNLRVVKVEGHPIGFYDSVLRNLVRGADFLPLTYAVGVISCLMTHRFQRLGDLAAGTIVIHEQKAWFSRGALADDGMISHPGLRGIALSNREQHLLQEFAVRKDRLHPERREELAQILVDVYRSRVHLAPETSASDVLLSLHASTRREGRS